MQQVDPKKKTQLYILFGLAAVVFLYVIYVLIQALAPPAPPAVAKTPPTPRGAAAGTMAATAAPGGKPLLAAPPAGAAFDLSKFNFLASGRDPFIIVPDDRLARESGIKPAPAPAPSPTPGGIKLAPLAPGPLPSFGDKSLTNRAIPDELRKIAPTPSPTPTVTVLPPAPPPYVVTGVLIGEPGGRDVAILRRGGTGGDKRFVTVGESLEGGYTITAIEANGVRVHHPGSQYSVPPSTAPGATPGVPGAPAGVPGTVIVPETTLTLPLGTATTPAAATPASPAGTAPNIAPPGMPRFEPRPSIQ